LLGGVEGHVYIITIIIKQGMQQEVRHHSPLPLDEIIKKKGK